jgi:YggT family protein
MMGNGYFTNPLEFLINVLFGFYVLAIMLRTLLAAVRADFYNPVSQFLVKVTNPALLPLRRVLPSVGRIDSSAIVLMLAVQMLAILLILLLRGGGVPLGALLFVSIAELVGLLFNIYIFSIIILAIISWVNPGSYNPVLGLLHSLTEPVMRPFRRLLPPVSGLDLSPMVALLALYLAKMLVLPLLFQLARL